MRLGLLRQHDFRQFFNATAVSQVATPISHLALPYAAITTLQASPSQVGLLRMFELLPMVLLGLLAGALVDRWPKRPVMVVTDIARALVLLTVPVAWWLDVLSITQLYLVALAMGALTIFFETANTAFLPQLVKSDQLMEGNSKLEGLVNTASIGGPALGGVLINALTLPVAVLTDALSYLGSALFLRRIRHSEPRRVAAVRPHLGREIMAGLRFVLGHRLLRDIFLSGTIFNFFGTMIFTVTMLLLVRDLGLTAGWVGLFLSFSAFGGLIGAVLARRITAWLGQGPAMLYAFGLGTPFYFALPLARPGWSTWAAALACGFVAAGVTIWNIIQRSFRQQLTPMDFMGRMQATMRFFAWSLMPVGAVLSGIAAEHFGVRTTLALCAAGILASGLPVLLSPLRSMRDLSAPPTGAGVDDHGQLTAPAQFSIVTLPANRSFADVSE